LWFLNILLLKWSLLQRLLKNRGIARELDTCGLKGIGAGKIVGDGNGEPGLSSLMKLPFGPLATGNPNTTIGFGLRDIGVKK
jgi:hypothetical protein